MSYKDALQTLTQHESVLCPRRPRGLEFTAQGSDSQMSDLVTPHKPCDLSHLRITVQSSYVTRVSPAGRKRFACYQLLPWNAVKVLVDLVTTDAQVILDANAEGFCNRMFKYWGLYFSAVYVILFYVFIRGHYQTHHITCSSFYLHRIINAWTLWTLLLRYSEMFPLAFSIEVGVLFRCCKSTLCISFIHLSGLKGWFASNKQHCSRVIATHI